MLSGGIDLGGLYELAELLAARRTCDEAGSRCARAPRLRHRRHPRRPHHAHHRVLRRWRRRQDHDRRSARRCGPPNGAATSSCSRSTRPSGWLRRWACPRSTTPRVRCRVSAPRRLGGSLFAMMLDMKRTFDEIVEAPRRPGSARSRSSTTPSTRRSRPRSPARRSTWRWRSSASSACAAEAEGHLGPHRRRHPAVAQRPGLPGRPGSGWARSSTAGSSGSSRRPPGGPARDWERLGPRWASGCSPTCSTRSSVPRCSSTSGTFVAAIDTTFGGFRERADETYALLQGLRDVVRRRRRPRA